jgi:hypothetical protein
MVRFASAAARMSIDANAAFHPIRMPGQGGFRLLILR